MKIEKKGGAKLVYIKHNSKFKLQSAWLTLKKIIRRKMYNGQARGKTNEHFTSFVKNHDFLYKY